MPTRICLEPTCPHPASYRGRCPKHATLRQRTITRAGRKVYSRARWKHTRERVLAANPICPCGQIAEDVHHIHDISQGGDPWALDGLQALCHACHAREGRRRQIESGQ